MEIVNEGFNEGPQIKLAPLQFDPDFGLETCVFLQHLVDQPFELLHVTTQSLQHLGCFSAGVLRRGYDDDNYTILVKEKIGNDVLVHVVSERDAKAGTAFHKKFNEGKNVWFRMEVEPGKLSGYYRTSSKEEWLKLGECDIPLRGEPKVGLTTAYAAKDAEHFTRFSNFRMLQIQMPPGKP